ncbi:putative reverse transcriptase domain-containing protein [Tanacetum coccineum]
MLHGLDQLMERKEGGGTWFPRSSSGYDTNWVIVDRLTKSADFLAIREDYKMEKLARLYIDEIVAGQGVPVSITSDRDGRFTLRFLANIIESLRTRLHMSAAHHPQTGGQSERTIQTLEDMLRACVIDFGGSWHIHLSLAECSYNNSYYSSIQCALFEALYGRKYMSSVLSAEKRLNTARDRQKSYADNRRKLLEFEVEDQVLLKVSPWKGKYLVDANLHAHLEEIKVDKTFCFVEEPVEIINRESCYAAVCTLVCASEVVSSGFPIVKVRRDSKCGPKFAWEREDHMKATYTRLFVDDDVE